ncbi:MAG: hypothetical protein GOMPHAMPRED_003253 [Gomphillus americanus]|uniref:Uncharacterized protein n=1 Tax=Gomphillus americanus TaxID=1940652 RepID=A0A8H3EEA4_9LECA|nr:MAG: hypothetical protein GOMPHAMPRED_003253 [Gomphillus americanus]
MGGPKLQDYCQLFDTVSLDFGKIIGAPGGTMVVSSQCVIDLAGQIQKPMGTAGQLGVLVAAAEGAFMERFGLDNPYDRNTIRDVHRTTRRVARITGLDREAFDTRAAQFGIKTDGPKLALHHQIQEEAIQRLGTLFANLLGHRANRTITGSLVDSTSNSVPAGDL